MCHLSCSSLCLCYTVLLPAGFSAGILLLCSSTLVYPQGCSAAQSFTQLSICNDRTQLIHLFRKYSELPLIICCVLKWDHVFFHLLILYNNIWLYSETQLLITFVIWSHVTKEWNQSSTHPEYTVELQPVLERRRRITQLTEGIMFKVVVKRKNRLNQGKWNSYTSSWFWY